MPEVQKKKEKKEKKKSAYDNAYKEYAKRYGISVLINGRPKSVQELTIDIYKHEIDNKIRNGLFPYLDLNW
jgi:hypothetical protein